MRLCDDESGAKVEVTRPVARKFQLQHRLQPAEIEDFVAAYRKGVPVKDLVIRFKIDRKTIYNQMNRRGFRYEFDRIPPIISRASLGDELQC